MRRSKRVGKRDSLSRQVCESKMVDDPDLAGVQMMSVDLENGAGSCGFRHSLLLKTMY
jgi:hypothetical protein